MENQDTSVIRIRDAGKKDENLSGYEDVKRIGNMIRDRYIAAVESELMTLQDQIDNLQCNYKELQKEYSIEARHKLSLSRMLIKATLRFENAERAVDDLRTELSSSKLATCLFEEENELLTAQIESLEKDLERKIDSYKGAVEILNEKCAYEQDRAMRLENENLNLTAKLDEMNRQTIESLENFLHEKAEEKDNPFDWYILACHVLASQMQKDEGMTNHEKNEFSKFCLYKALEGNKDAVSCQIMDLGNTFLELCRYDLAEAVFNEIVKSDPDNNYAWLQLHKSVASGRNCKTYDRQEWKKYCEFRAAQSCTMETIANSENILSEK